MPFYYVLFKVSGTDHCGYCSGQEGDEIRPYYEFKNIKKQLPITNIEDFTDMSMGCTAGGSGYCSGCEQTYTPILFFQDDENIVTRVKYLVTYKDHYETIVLPFCLPQELIRNENVRKFFHSFNQYLREQHGLITGYEPELTNPPTLESIYLVN